MAYTELLTTKNGEKRVKATFRNQQGMERSKTFRIPNDGRAERTRINAATEIANAWLLDQRHSLRHDAYIDPKDARIPFLQWYEQWATTQVGKRPSTTARDESYVRTHIMPTFAAVSLGSIDYPMVQSWVARLSTTKSPATVRKAYEIFAKIMRSAVRAKRLASTPCVDVELPRIEQQEMRFLSPNEILQLADAIDDRYKALVTLASYGGLRIGEIAALKASSIDFLRRRVRVSETCVEVHGRIHWNAPKTRAGARYVSLPAPVMEELALAEIPG